MKSSELAALSKNQLTVHRLLSTADCHNAAGFVAPGLSVFAVSLNAKTCRAVVRPWPDEGGCQTLDA